tara:strand:+ start:409 stop:1209 length:801 start_codon:yes stop_codon:yes gene_type:complete
MQRNRNIRKVIQPPMTVGHTTNIQRRAVDTRNFTKTSPAQAARISSSKNISVVNSAQPAITKIQYSTIQKKFEGETVYIIGGGPSLKKFDFRQLIGSRTIAINKSLLFYAQADVLYWTDVRFYLWHKNEVDNYKGLKFTLKAGSQYTDDINILKKGKAYGIEKDRQTLAHGNNSGYAAINLAYHLGAKRIVLLGFDMGSNGVESHFHDGYPTRPAGDKMYQDKFLPGFKQLKAELKDSGVIVLNASPYSKLTTFPKITLEQALSFR